MKSMIKDYVKDCMIKSFLDEQDEFKYENVYLEYTCYPIPHFYVVKEGDQDPQLCEGVCFSIMTYMDKFKEKWMKAMIEDISNEIVKNLDKTPLQMKLDIIRHQVFELGKIQ